MRNRTLAVVVIAILCFGCSTAISDEPRVFFGNLHSHTSYSDGSGTPEEAYVFARNEGHLDFLAITEHNHANQIKPKTGNGDPIGKDHTLYSGTQPDSLINTAARFNIDGKFVALYGQEFSTISSGNHANVFEVGEVITSQSGHFEQLVNDWLPTHLDSAHLPAIVQFNHPSKSLRSKEYGHDDFHGDKDWIDKMGRYACLIEVLNGPGLSKEIGRQPTVFESDYKHYLNLGFHLGPTGDQDNHYETWGKLTEARTGIVAEHLTKTDILAAMRARHVYATEDKNLRAIFRVRYPGIPDNQPLLCGDVVRAPPPVNTELAITYSLTDDDEPEADYHIDVFAGNIDDDLPTVIEQHSQEGNTTAGQPGTIGGVKYTGGRQFVYFRVTQGNVDGDEDRLWTAPIWFDAGSGDGSGDNIAVAAPDESAFLASKKSKIYHTDPSCRDAQGISPANRLTGHAATEGRTPHQGCPR